MASLFHWVLKRTRQAHRYDQILGPHWLQPLLEALEQSVQGGVLPEGGDVVAGDSESAFQLVGVDGYENEESGDYGDLPDLEVVDLTHHRSAFFAEAAAPDMPENRRARAPEPIPSTPRPRGPPAQRPQQEEDQERPEEEEAAAPADATWYGAWLYALDLAVGSVPSLLLACLTALLGISQSNFGASTAGIAAVLVSSWRMDPGSQGTWRRPWWP